MLPSTLRSVLAPSLFPSLSHTHAQMGMRGPRIKWWVPWTWEAKTDRGLHGCKDTWLPRRMHMPRQMHMGAMGMAASKLPCTCLQSTCLSRRHALARSCVQARSPRGSTSVPYYSAFACVAYVGSWGLGGHVPLSYGALVLRGCGATRALVALLAGLVALRAPRLRLFNKQKAEELSSARSWCLRCSEDTIERSMLAG
jgi:hypothetical protein